jgi:phosphoglycolate phosphatase
MLLVTGQLWFIDPTYDNPMEPQRLNPNPQLPLTLVFDLDGTLVDTAPDLIAATNHVMAGIGRTRVADDVVRPQVSHGALAMIRAAIGPEADDWPEERLYPLFEQFIVYYQANIAVESRPFPGMLEALDRAAAAGHTLAVCTNKREVLARQLLESLGLTARFAAIAGRDTFPVYKPDPGHLLSTIAMTGGNASHAVMIGDSGVDVATAKAANIPVIAVSFGYSAPPVAHFDPDIIIHHYDAFDEALAALVVSRPPRV